MHHPSIKKSLAYRTYAFIVLFQEKIVFGTFLTNQVFFRFLLCQVDWHFFLEDQTIVQSRTGKHG